MAGASLRRLVWPSDRALLAVESADPFALGAICRRCRVRRCIGSAADRPQAPVRCRRSCETPLGYMADRDNGPPGVGFANPRLCCGTPLGCCGTSSIPSARLRHSSRIEKNPPPPPPRPPPPNPPPLRPPPEGAGPWTPPSEPFHVPSWYPGAMNLTASLSKPRVVQLCSLSSDCSSLADLPQHGRLVCDDQHRHRYDD